MRVIAKVNALKGLAVGVQVLRALTLAGLRLQDLRGGERLIGEVLAGQRNLTQDAVGVILQFGAFPAAQDGVDEAELLGGGVPGGQLRGVAGFEAVALPQVRGHVGDARAGITQGLLGSFKGAFLGLAEGAVSASANTEQGQ